MKILRPLWILLTLGAATVHAVPEEDGLYVTLQTTMGAICIELDAERAPLTSANMIALAEGSRPWVDPQSGRVITNRYYDGVRFHRVISNFMIQAGSPQGTGTDGPGYVLPDEFHPTLLHDGPGVVSMANSGPNSSGGQFFITVTNTPWLNNLHSVFGRVVEGMDTVYAIASTAVTNNRPVVDVVITQAVVNRIGEAAAAFDIQQKGLPEARARGLSLGLTTTLVASVSVSPTEQVAVYASTNLSGWYRYRDHYRTTGDGPWSVSAPTSAVSFLTGCVVGYSTDTNTPASPSGRTLTLTFPVNTIEVSPLPGMTGTCRVNQLPTSPLTYWEWGRTPHKASLLFYAANYSPFYMELFYDSPTNGRCKGLYYASGMWIPIEAGAVGRLTDAPAPL